MLFSLIFIFHADTYLLAVILSASLHFIFSDSLLLSVVLYRRDEINESINSFIMFTILCITHKRVSLITSRIERKRKRASQLILCLRWKTDAMENRCGNWMMITMKPPGKFGYACLQLIMCVAIIQLAFCRQFCGGENARLQKKRGVNCSSSRRCVCRYHIIHSVQ